MPYFISFNAYHSSSVFNISFVFQSHHDQWKMNIRALSAHSAVDFNISPGRWQHVWLVAIVPTDKWGGMDRNDCHTAWGNFKRLISLLHHYKNYACSFSFSFFFSLLLSIAIERLQVTTFLTLAGVANWTK
jgi:hypothetical protein